MFRKINQKRKLFIVTGLLLLVIMVVFGVFADTALGQGTATGGTATMTEPQGGNLPGQRLAKLLADLFAFFISVVGKLLTLFISVVIGVLEFNNFVDSRAVALGWVMVRDLANMFFIVIILLIAFGTLFNIETYQYKKLLPKLIIAAVLVNFSKMIVGLFIDLGQTVMMTFVNAWADGAAGGFLNALGVEQMLQLRDVIGKTDQEIDHYAIAGSVILAFIMLLIAALVILTMIAVLLARIIMLWILLIFSPIVFIASAMPNGPLDKIGMFGQYWSYLTKYIIVGPILAFFLWLSFGILQQIGEEDKSHVIELYRQKPEGHVDRAKYVEYLASKISSPQRMFDYMTTIALLIASLLITQQMGVMGGNIGMNAVTKVKDVAQRGLVSAAKWTAKKPFQLAAYGERKLYKTTGFSALNPMRKHRKRKAIKEKNKAMDEIEGQKKAGDVSQALYREGWGRLGMTYMRQGDQDDYDKYYGGLRGKLKMMRTWSGAEKYGTKAQDKADEKLEDMGMDELLNYQAGAKHIDAVEEGKDALFKQEKENRTNYNERQITGGQGRVILIDEKGDIVQGDMDEDDPAYSRLRSAYAKELENTVQYAALGDSTEDKQKKKDMVRDKIADDYANKKNGIALITTTGDDGKPITEIRDFNSIVKKDIAKMQVDRDEDWQERQKARINQKDESELKKRGIDSLNEKVSEKKKELEEVEKGGLTANQKEVKIGRATELEEEMGALKQEMKKLRKEGKEGERENVGYELAEKLKEQKKMARKDSKGEWIAKLSKEELKVNKKSVKNEEGKISGEARKMQKNIWEMQGAVVFANGNMKGIGGQDIKTKDDVKEESKKLTGIKKSILAEVSNIPRTLQADNAYRLLESEELQNLPKDSMEAEELNSLIDDAVKNRDRPRLAVLLKKAAQDYNDNEFLNHSGYTSNAKGMQSFSNEILEGKAGMTKNQALGLMNEIAYINESRGHTETSRLITFEKGMPKWMKEEEHAAAVANEVLKQPSRAFLQNTNRLGYGGETAGGDYELALSGKLMLIGTQDDLMNRFERGEFNGSAFQKIAMEQLGEIKKLEEQGLITARGVGSKYQGMKMSEILGSMAKGFRQRGVYANYSSLKDKAEFMKHI